MQFVQDIYNFFFRFDSLTLESRRLDFVRFETFHTWSEDEKSITASTVGNIICKYGQYFRWTHRHIDQKCLENWRRIGDPAADNCLNDLTDDAKDLVQSIFNVHSPASKNLLSRYSQSPQWLDWDKLFLGQQVFLRYLPICSISLFYCSLLGGFSAPKITKVLMATGYLTGAPRRIKQRLADTFSMVVDCLLPGGIYPPPKQSDGGFGRPGDGWEAVMRARMLHASVRKRLISSGSWQEDSWGVPVNQEDMAATCLAFSYNVLCSVEFVLGRPLSIQDQEAYTHLWRYIGWLMGLDDECNPCKSVGESKVWLESIVVHLLHPNDDSRAVAMHLLGFRGHAGMGFRAALCRSFLGAPLCDALELPQPSLMARTLAWSLLCCLRIYGRLAGWAPIAPAMLLMHTSAVRELAPRLRTLRQRVVVSGLAEANPCPMAR